MRRWFAYIVLLMFTVLPLHAQTSYATGADGDKWLNTDYNTTEGTDFWLTFMFNYGNTEKDVSDLHLRVFATAREQSVVTIHYMDGTTETFTVQPRKRAQQEIDIQKGYIIREDEVENKGLHITSTKPISLYAVSQNAVAGSQDATCVLPTKALQCEYVLQTYGTDGASTEFAIVATEATNNVEMHIKKTHYSDPSQSIQDSVVNTGPMLQGDVYLFRSNGANFSLSGTHICTQVPIAVFVGGQHADIPFMSANKNHIYSQAYPTDMWGKEFVATKSHGQRYDYLRFTAAQTTNIQVLDPTKSSSYTNLVSSLAAFETYQDSLFDSDCVNPTAKAYKANKAIEAYSYLTDWSINSTMQGYTIVGEGAPAMASITPVEQGMKSLVFSTLDAVNIQSHYVNIVTYDECKSSMKLDDENIGDKFHPIAGTPYAFAEIKVDTGAHYLVNEMEEKANNVFTVQVYGFGQPDNGTRRESYAYAAGSRIERSADLLMNDRYIDSLEMCDNDMVDLEGIIRYDYSTVEWLLVDSAAMMGLKTGDTTTLSFDGRTVNDVHFPHIEDNLPHDWTVNMFVSRTTPLCSYAFLDTITANIRVYPTHVNDTVWDPNGEPKEFCYGDQIQIEYSEDGDKEHVIMHTFVADTVTPAAINKIPYGTIKFELDSVYTILDSLKNQFGCDSVIEKKFIIYPTYDTLVYDTTCYKNLPYEWRREDNGALIRMLTKDDMVNKHDLILKKEHTFKTDSIYAEETLRTIHGCDSVVRIWVQIMPDYELHDTLIACRDTVPPSFFVWENHTTDAGSVISGHRLQQKVGNTWQDVSSISLMQNGNFLYRDSLPTTYPNCVACATNGVCDSIWYLHLQVLDHYKAVFDSAVCEDSFVYWEDTLRIGPKCPNPMDGRPWIRYADYDNKVEIEHPSSRYGECDSLFVLNLHFCKTYTTEEIFHICENEKYHYRPRFPMPHDSDFVYNANGEWACRIESGHKVIGRYVLTDTVKTILPCNDKGGCDSVVTHVVYVHPVYNYTFDTVVCQTHGGRFTWQGHTDTIPLGTAGDFVYVDSLKTKTCTDCMNGVGCDSIWVLQLHINPIYDPIVSKTLCENDSLHWEGKVYVGGKAPDAFKQGQSTFYWATTQGTKAYPHRYENVTRYDGVKYCDTVHLHTVNGCDSIIWLNLTVYPTYHTDHPATICETGEYDFHGHIFKDLAPGSYVHDTILKTIDGCDSLVTLQLTVHPVYDVTTTVVRCESEMPYRWELDGTHDQTIQIPADKIGTVWHYTSQYTLHTIHGCDSVVHLDLTVKPTTFQEYSVVRCANEAPYPYGDKGKTATKTGTYRDTLSVKNHYGCDSVVILHLQADSVYAYVTDTAICQNESFVWPNHTGSTNHVKDASGHAVAVIPTNHIGIFEYTDSLQTQAGCDSVWTLRLRVDSVYTSPVTVTSRQMCENDTLHFYDKVIYGAKSPLKPSGTTGYGVPEGQYSISFDTTYTDHTIHGCDSAVMHRITVFPTRYNLAIDTVCLDTANSHYTWIGHEQVEVFQNSIGTKTYVDSLHSTHTDCACDSIFELQLTVLPSYFNKFSHTMSEEDVYTWEHVTYGGVKATSTHDKTVTKDTVISVSYQTDSIGTYQCDSILQLSLRIGKVTRDTTHLYVCEDAPSFEWKRANKDGVIETRKTISGSDLPEVKQHKLYYDSLQTILGFDSIFILDLYRAPTYAFDSTAHICQYTPFVWKRHDGPTNHVEDADGHPVTQIPTDRQGMFFYYDRLATDSFGCDSVWTLRLYVDSVYAYVTDMAICQNEPFEWTNHTSPANHVKDASGHAVSVIPTNHIGVFEYTDSLLTQAGCDSVWTLRLRVDSVYTSPVTVTARQMCENDTLHFYDKVIYGAKSPLKPSGATGYGVPEGQYSISFDTTYTDHTIHGCDSAVMHHITIYPTYAKEHVDSVCQGSAYVWDGHTSEYIWDVRQQKRIRLTDIPTEIKSGVVYEYIDSLHTTACPECREGAGGCDSIWTLKLRVDSVYYHADTITMSDEESRKWQHTVYIGSKVDADTLNPSWFAGETQQQIIRIPDGQIVNEFDTVYPTIHQCDSTIHLRLLVGITYRDTIEGWTCDNEPYHWYHAGDSIHEARPDIEILEPKLYYDSLRTVEFGFDSIYVLILHNYPTYHFAFTDTVCQGSLYHWEGHTESDQFYSVEHGRWIHRDAIPTDVSGYFTYIDSLKTHEPGLHPDQNRHNGCDSIWTLNLYIPPIYDFYDTIPLCENDSAHWQGMLFVGNQYEAYGKTYDVTPFDSARVDMSHGVYHVDIRRPSIFGCDSTYHLTLRVNQVAHVDSIDSVCQGSPFFNPNWNWGEGRFMETEHVGTYISVDTIPSATTGCDSIVTLTLRVDSVYNYGISYTFCQDTIDTMREWIDEENVSHGFVLDVSRPGDFEKTLSFTTIHGCDSSYGVRWHVDPIYRFDSTYVICEDERVTWQGRGYSGDKYGWGFERLNGDRYDTHRDSVYYHYVLGDSILTPGIYYDTAHYTTVEGCDSIFYMQLTVHPAGHYLQEELACDNDKFHVFYSSDVYGEHTDTVFFDRTTRMINETQRDTMFFEVERRLTAVNGGCDSTIHFHLTVHPSYEFVTRAKVCWEDTYEWRGNSYFSAGVYYDSIPGGTDYWGCDSVYVLELYKKPVSLVPIYDTICDDVTYQHVDTMWYTNGTHTYVETMVWKPGMTIPQSYTDVIFKGADGCDSIIYRYFLTINPTYVVHDTATLCSNDTYTSGEHTFSGHEVEFDTDRYILPFDTLITDTYQSIHGCDSIYHLHATLYPAYRHKDTLVICDDGEVTWRDHTLRGSMFGDVFGDGYAAGEHIVRDSFLTVLNCDSIYELHLMVQPTYLFVDSLTKCADDTLNWRSFNLDHLPAGDHFIPDSLTTIGFGCDSVYHLYITVLDTTYEVRHDTICRSEVYDLHGVEISEPGYYKDTTLNEWGCNHFTYLYLEVIEPTIPTAWADSICADDNAYELYCTYTGRDPIGFSLFYSNEAHFYGFEDIVDSTIYDVRELYPLTLPMPRVDEDRKNYPKPDFYDIRLVLDNGICTNPDLCATDTAIVLSYPSWITRQRFGDVIALYNEDYNGGYQWDHYQWYHDGEELIGETHEYLYVPTGLIVGDRYHVRLTRTGETQDFQTCPITIIADPVYDDFAPTMGYLSVVPTCIDVDYPHAYILSRKDGTYRVSDPNGRLVTSGEFHADVTEVILPSVDGMYIFQLWSPQTPEEPYRAIKVIVSESCPNYDMPF